MRRWYGQNEDGYGWMEFQGETDTEDAQFARLHPGEGFELRISKSGQRHRIEVVRKQDAKGDAKQPDPDTPDFDSMNMDDLKTYAAEHNVEIASRDRRGDIIQKLLSG